MFMPPETAQNVHCITTVCKVASFEYRELLKLQYDRRTRKLRLAAAATQAPPVIPIPSSGGVPAWFVTDIACINRLEESGAWSTSAGGLGFIYPPISYGGVAATLAQQYGDSWYAWPAGAQIEVAWMLYVEYGWSPWSTAASCGL